MRKTTLYEFIVSREERKDGPREKKEEPRYLLNYLKSEEPILTSGLLGAYFKYTPGEQITREISKMLHQRLGEEVGANYVIKIYDSLFVLLRNRDGFEILPEISLENFEFEQLGSLNLHKALQDEEIQNKLINIFRYFLYKRIKQILDEDKFQVDWFANKITARKCSPLYEKFPFCFFQTLEINVDFTENGYLVIQLDPGIDIISHGSIEDIIRENERKNIDLTKSVEALKGKYVIFRNLNSQACRYKCVHLNKGIGKLEDAIYEENNLNSGSFSTLMEELDSTEVCTVELDDKKSNLIVNTDEGDIIPAKCVFLEVNSTNLAIYGLTELRDKSARVPPDKRYTSTIEWLAYFAREDENADEGIFILPVGSHYVTFPLQLYGVS